MLCLLKGADGKLIKDMKKINAFALRQLEGEKMSKLHQKIIVGGYNMTDCCGDSCMAMYIVYPSTDDWFWIGCAKSGNPSDQCCYGK